MNRARPSNAKEPGESTHRGPAKDGLDPPADPPHQPGDTPIPSPGRDHESVPANPSPGTNESRYRPAAPARPSAPPPRVHIELVAVDGREGQLLRARQAHAIREALRWFQHQHDDHPAATGDQ